MQNSLSNFKISNLCLFLIVSTTLVGPMIYIGVASLYHFVIFALLAVVLLKGVYTGIFRTSIMGFLLIWFVEALVSMIWAPDKMLAIQYAYYVFLILGICVLFHCFLSRTGLTKFMQFMVIVLLICNIIAIVEMTTGKHIVKGYLATPLRLRLLKYMPGGFYRNPNDFATFIIQIIPFSFACLVSSKRFIRIVSVFNVVASFFVICATQSRAQILLMLAMCIFFVLIFRKKMLLQYGFLALVSAIVLYFIYPEFNDLIDKALKSITGESMVSDATIDGGSMSIRINLLKNAGYILLDTFGFGIGAGCHRAVMAAYSAQYYNVGLINVMHNLLGELFVDYGILVGISFLITILAACIRLVHICKKEENYQIRLLACMLVVFIGGFVFCGMSSSSIIQLTSVWTTFCFTSAFIKLYD